MSYQFTDNVRDVRFPRVLATDFIGSDVFPFPFMNGSVIIWRFQLNVILLLIRVVHAFVFSLSKKNSGFLYRNSPTYRFGPLDMTTQTLVLSPDAWRIKISSPG